MSNWYVSHVHPPEPPKTELPYWFTPHHAHHHAHHHGCGCAPNNSAPVPSNMLNDMLERVKGIPGTHEFTLTRTVEKEKTPWEKYEEELAEYYKKYPHMHPHYRQPPPQAPAHHHCAHHWNRWNPCGH